MKRTKTNTSAKKETKQVTKKTTDAIRWQKVGGGRLSINDQIILPGQIFLAKESDIPKAFRDTLLKEGERGFGDVKVKMGDPFYDRKQGGKYDVYNKKGVKVLEEVTLEEAKVKIKELKSKK